jgi:hypothetical protein
MKLINARQAWTDAQHESNASISAAAADRAKSATVVRKEKAALREVIFAAQGEDKEERIMAVRQKIHIAETRRAPIGRSTHRAAHLVAMGKVQKAIESLPFQVQQLGHYLYHPCMTVVHMLNAEKLIWSDTDFSSLTDAKAAKVHCLITCALQSYKAEACGGDAWGPARVSGAMMKLYGIAIQPKHWDRDWLDIWNFLRKAIEEVDIRAQEPVWQVIHTEKSEDAA